MTTLDPTPYSRLLSEIAANVTLTDDQMQTVAEAMDLSTDDITGLFKRAQADWETTKTQARYGVVVAPTDWDDPGVTVQFPQRQLYAHVYERNDGIELEMWRSDTDTENPEWHEHFPSPILARSAS